MKVLVLGAGIIGVSTAWHLLQNGHEVTLVDRQEEAASETSFANAAQISVSYCEPWANKDAPLKALKWMFSDEAPLLFRPQFPLGKGWHQYRWGLEFLANCNDRAFERNVAQIVALGSYSHAALKDVVAQTGMDYNRLQKGIAHIFTDERAFAAAEDAAELMRRHGVQREVVSTHKLLRIEPAFKSFASRIVGGTYTASDESGDAREFTRQLAERCGELGAQLLFGHDVLSMHKLGNAIDSVALRARSTGVERTIHADAVVVACGSYSAPLLRTVGVNLPVYPGKGYSVTLPLLKPELAPQVSTIDDEKKIAMTRLGNYLRVAGTIEVGGYDLSLDSPLAQKRCEMLLKRIETILPGVADTRTPAQGGNPQYWCGLRPATPTNIPFIGKTKVNKLWVNTGHGTLGWTHGAGSGKAIAELISGRKPEMAFDCLGS
ncbi:D-amino acid dehydrogenase [Variovorax sp. PCZ-1]|uniref:D-amino acid dehydrogenase n=1 Tax=Variovorax sp. PCZ-1 TaxID=2835533 RepID=UPI001BCDB2B7|nr:D-amino acid dehydrogenase [Variovorax sp. PCZ-1]MBS7809006.1 D-amino acid dehydrogenase [Variovorax sp. PCZ-1]